jgi:hypothetical protein
LVVAGEGGQVVDSSLQVMHNTQAGVEPPPTLAVAGFEVDMLVVEVGLEHAALQLCHGCDHGLDVARQRDVPGIGDLVADHQLAAGPAGHALVGDQDVGDAVSIQPHPASVDMGEEAVVVSELRHGRTSKRAACNPGDNQSDKSARAAHVPTSSLCAVGRTCCRKNVLSEERGIAAPVRPGSRGIL